MNRSHVVRYVLVIILVMLALSACDKSSANASNNTSNRPNNNPSQNNNTPNTNNNPGKGDFSDEDPGAGPDEDAEEIKAGWAQGTWRIATVPDDAPIVFIDVFHDEGKPALTGTFIMMPFEGFDGETGELLEGSTYENGTLTLKLAPSADPNDVWTIQGTKQGEDKLLTGKLTTVSGSYNLNVAIELAPQ
jgi:hypothetical protein